jgi:cytochrome c-type biogenesis protein CcmE
MRRSRKFLVGGGIIAAALAGLVVTGVQQSVVYFVTPSELRAATGRPARAYRLGGMVVPGSLRKDVGALRYDFRLTDGRSEVPVRFRGIPPDLFAEGRGAVVEGALGADGTFEASTIMAKHSEEYQPPHEAEPGYRELLRTLRGDDRPAAKPGG